METKHDHLENEDIPVIDESHLYEVEAENGMIEEQSFANATPWLDWAKKQVGQHETAKTGHSNPFIVGLFRHTTYKTNTDRTPWCAAFVSSALELTGFKSAHSASAFAYEKYGTHCEAKTGAIVVFHWPTGGGHVSIVHSVGNGVINCLGGNQTDSVKISTFSKAHAKAFRWPVK